MKRLLLSLFLLSSLFLGAQNHEAGIRFQGLSNFDFIYKKPSASGHFHRFRLAFVNLTALNRASTTDLNLGLGLAYGFEKRKALAEKTFFIHGIEPALIGNFRPNGRNLGFQLGYVLGLQYDFHSDFYINLELTPSLSFDAVFNDGQEAVYQYGFFANSQFLALSLVHRF